MTLAKSIHYIDTLTDAAFREQGKHWLRLMHRIGMHIEAARDEEKDVYWIRIVVFPESEKTNRWIDIVHTFRLDPEQIDRAALIKMQLEYRVRLSAIAYHSHEREREAEAAYVPGQENVLPIEAAEALDRAGAEIVEIVKRDP